MSNHRLRFILLLVAFVAIGVFLTSGVVLAQNKNNPNVIKAEIGAGKLLHATCIDGLWSIAINAKDDVIMMCVPLSDYAGAELIK